MTGYNAQGQNRVPQPMMLVVTNSLPMEQLRDRLFILADLALP